MRFVAVLWLVALVFLSTLANRAEAASAFQAAGAAVSGTGTVSPAWPAHAVNDIALLFVESAGGELAPLNTPAGFAAVANSPQVTGAGTAGTRITVFWARATSTTMATPTVGDPGNHVYAQIITYRGVATTANPWDVTGGGVKAAASGAVTVTGVTTTVANTLIVQAVARDNDSAAAAFSAITNTALSGITLRSDAGTASGNGGGFAVWDGIHVVPSAIGDTTANVTNSINAFLTIALRPATQPPAPACAPPANIPAGVTVTCQCDSFGRATLNPSTIFNSNWIASVSPSDPTGQPAYLNTGTGLLRLTEDSNDNAKAATVPGIYPATGNYISVEFQHFAYDGSGADGIAVTLSDYSVPAVPGAFGGSLGYAQKNAASCALPGGCPGFAGGWIGVAIDEFGNFQNPSEGRIGGPGQRVDSISIRGSGTGLTGYNWMAGTAANLVPQIDNTGSNTPAPGHYYQVIVDARNEPTSTSVTVNRDTAGAGTYTPLINVPDVYAAATGQGFTQAAVPANWQISFTGSTGGATNIHEIGGVRICAQTSAPPSGGTASGFNAIDGAYATAPATPAVQNFLTGHIYMKLAGSPFRLWVAALNNNQILTTYAAGAPRNVTVKLVDNSDNGCVLDSTQPGYCSAACAAKPAVTGGSQTLTFTAADAGKKQSADFTLNTSYRNLAAIIADGTTTACSTDAFSVRPVSIASVTSSNATQAGTSGPPIFKAGSDNFSLTATTTGIGTFPSGYTGVLKINNAAVQAVAPATFVGAVAPTTFPAATSATPSSTATGATFTYSEVGAFNFRGYNPATDATSPRGVYDGVAASECAAPVTPAQCDILRAATWTGIDSISSKNDCVANNYSNTLAAGKYGCNFGIIVNTAGVGRFTPAYFDVVRTHGCAAGNFTYAGVLPVPPAGQPGQPFSVTATAFNAFGVTTQNYHSAYGLAKDTTISNAGNATGFGNNVLTAATGAMGFTNGVATTNTIHYSFATKETAPLTLNLRATDTDGVSSVGHIEQTTQARSGRIAIQNAFGSELVDLNAPMRIQYYESSAAGFTTNVSDNCTAVSLALSNYQGNLAAGETCVHDTGNPGLSTQGCAPAGPATRQFREAPVAGFNGDFNLWLRAPGNGNDGSVDIGADLSALPWLRFDWDGNGANDNDPVGRATFGNFRGNPRHIYLRERY